MNALPRLAESPIEAIDEAESTLVAIMEELRSLEGVERSESLAAWAKSEWFSPCGFILEGWQGELHLEAWRHHCGALEADCPGKTWNNADHKAGRASINRLLGVEGKYACYATYPFRLIWTQEDEPWIGAAVGCAPLLNATMLSQWEHVDIRQVILWSPKSGETRLLGDDQPTHIILPEPEPDTLEVFTDTRAFFSAWARRRASFAAMGRLHGLNESRDGHLPGALVVGRIDKVRFPRLATSTLVAHRPLSSRSLRDAVLRSANLPRIEEAAVAHG